MIYTDNTDIWYNDYTYKVTNLKFTVKYIFFFFKIRSFQLLPLYNGITWIHLLLALVT